VNTIVACLCVLAAATPSAPPRTEPPVAPPAYASEEALRRYAQGRLLEDQGDGPAAVGEYLRGLVGDPRSVATLRRLSELASQAGDLTRAREYADRALELDPRDARSLWLKGAAQFNAGAPEASLATLEAAVAADSSQTEYLRTLSRVAEELDRYDVVARACRRIVTLEPADGEAWFQLGAAEARLGRFGPARRALQEAEALNPVRPGMVFLKGWVAEGLNQPDSAIVLYREHLAMHGGDDMTRRRLVGLYIRQGRWKEAAPELEQLLSRQPSDPDLLADLADVQFHTGKADQAMRTIERLRVADPDDHMLLSMRLHVLVKNERIEEAAFEASEWSARNPGDYRGPLLMGRALAMGRRFEPAEAQARRAIELAPDSLAPYVLLGGIHQTAKQWQAAASIWEDVLRRFGEDASISLDLATCYIQLGRPGEAEAIGRRLLARQPDSPVLLNYVGYLLADENRELPEAEQLVRRALAQDPDNGAYVDSMGWIYYRLGRLEDARRELERALDLTGGDSEVREHLGDVYRDLRLPDRAREQYRRALEDDQDNRRVRQKLEALR
jgi:tetratricopeptide (TPR) repeat protein